MDSAPAIPDAAPAPAAGPPLAACPRCEHQIPLGLGACPVCGLALDPPSIDIYFARQRTRFAPVAGAAASGSTGATLGLVFGLLLTFAGIAALAGAYVYPSGFNVAGANAIQTAQVYSQAGYNAALAVGVLLLALLCLLPWVRSR